MAPKRTTAPGQKVGLVLRFQLQHGAMKARRHKEKETTARATLKGRMKGSNRERVTVGDQSVSPNLGQKEVASKQAPLARG